MSFTERDLKRAFSRGFEGYYRWRPWTIGRCLECVTEWDRNTIPFITRNTMPTSTAPRMVQLYRGVRVEPNSMSRPVPLGFRGTIASTSHLCRQHAAQREILRSGAEAFAVVLIEAAAKRG